MMQENRLDLLDQRLIHAVQLSPRASWTALAPIVGADAATLGRRWARLTSDGIVYVTGYASGGGVMALVEVECTPGETLAVAAELSHDREAFTIDLTAGGRDILLTLGTTDADTLATWTLERVRTLPAIRAMRTHLVSDVVADARSWRLRALTREEAARVQATDRSSSIPPVHLRPEQRRAIIAALAADGRIGTTALAARVGVSPRRVRDAVAGMRAAGSLVVRVDIARAHTPWPVYAWYFLRVPAAMVAHVGAQLGRMEEVRLVVTAPGRYNVIMAVWLHALRDVTRLEAAIEDRLPGVTIADRSVVLRTTKHLGHVLDDRGRVTSETTLMP